MHVICVQIYNFSPKWQNFSAEMIRPVRLELPTYFYNI